MKICQRVLDFVHLNIFVNSLIQNSKIMIFNLINKIANETMLDSHLNGNWESHSNLF